MPADVQPGPEPSSDVLVVNETAQCSAHCIVVVGYNRAEPIKRLLRSLLVAEYDGHRVDLFLSIDGSPSAEAIVSSCAEIEWPHGRFSIRRFHDNLGLRKHVLASGDLVRNHDAIIMLEDDLQVSSQFYRFTLGALEAYAAKDGVAGISLYSPSINEMANLPFEPGYSSADVFALQSAQSWGQVWTKSMWLDFISWYEQAPPELAAESDMPERIYSWPESSWKKFAMKYLVETGRTWIYPYRSHSTNFSEIGRHNKVLDARYQVALDNCARQYSLPALDDLVAYDIFFERSGEQLISMLPENTLPLALDLYGTRQHVIGPALLATTRIMEREPLLESALQLRPHEDNVQHPSPGKDFGLYPVEAGECINLLDLKSREALGFRGNLEWRKSLKFGLEGLHRALRRKLSALPTSR